ncbi:alpha-ribazole phosphatase family protein [Marinobacter sp. TBZ242]|uniref:Alpha-ribazole phosphatase family protein n=1 Tax=Marinobacter azerbaijanicus TaxID=3050455 RepID=A0ABT7ICN2_9GAMM|nr:alpha-ribazole phosphatase family protein [Marinobacter sp. TBZ242]MDL0431916.1 alpha-ribazole phosphatase family protein [Marinobacter sp. TBZ242]
MQNLTTTIDLIRHGEPAGGPMFRGNRDDPLSDLGWQQMRSAISKADQWDLVVTSPLLRCRRFAEQLASERQLTLEQDERLREISFGAWEGMTADAILAQTPEALTRFWNDPVANPPPEGEPVAGFHARVREAWSHWCREAAGQHVLVVCHGGVIRMILAEVMGIPLDRSFSALAVPYACRSRVRIDQSEHGVFSCLQSHGC